MVFSSFATDLSANSARVSACGKHTAERVSCSTQWVVQAALHSKSAPFASLVLFPRNPPMGKARDKM